MVDISHEVDTSRFLNSTDDQLRVFAVTLMMDTYALSETWRAKGIFVPKIEDNLLQDLTESIYAFKSGRLAQMISELRERLRTATDDEQRELLVQIQQYNGVMRQLQQARNIVIAPRCDSF
jgi:hypothetical protein